MFGIGIIGCGKIAQVRHLPEYAENKDAKLVGLYDINLARAQSLAEQYGATAYATVEDLLANPEQRTGFQVGIVAHRTYQRGL